MVLIKKTRLCFVASMLVNNMDSSIFIGLLLYFSIQMSISCVLFINALFFHHKLWLRPKREVLLHLQNRLLLLYLIQSASEIIMIVLNYLLQRFFSQSWVLLTLWSLLILILIFHHTFHFFNLTINIINACKTFSYFRCYLHCILLQH